MIKTRNRSTETIVYAALWLIAVGLYLLDAMRGRAQLSEPLIDMNVLGAMARTMIPFLVLFIVNNNLLIPRLLLKNRILPYFILTAAAVIILWGYQSIMFFHKMNMMPIHPHPAPHPYLRPLLPLPLFLDFTYALLVDGCNLAIALMFQRYDDKLENESLMKANAENQLAYLKAQINPHFYMNMLNNIHGMIEIDPDKAQSMVLEMSHLMRYMLYDSSKPLIPLADETAFLRNYLNLMRQRYPANAVSITSQFPADSEARHISMPPLLFLVFIENAFKHGISYQQPSFVSVSIEINGDTVTFNCMNSRVAHDTNRTERSGIGLRNIRQRLALLYGTRASLQIAESESTYTVNLTLPINETENTDNR